MQKSESIVELTKALIKVQSQLKGAKMDSVNPFYHAKYASLASVWDACRKLLSDNGLAVIQTNSVGEGHKLIIDTILIHSSGEWVCGSLPMILSKDDPQGIGMAITYGRRYGLSAIIGICTEDDDAEPTIDRKPQETTKQVDKKPEQQTGEKHFDNAGQLLTECAKYTNAEGKKITRQMVCDAIGVKEPKEITNFDEAWTIMLTNVIRVKQ